MASGKEEKAATAAAATTTTTAKLQHCLLTRDALRPRPLVRHHAVAGLC